ncbi:Afadin and alpha-actinin-binding-domain-containing protein [Kockovaella imperatae]|uniref:Afadin and alpha-actinin-binding-domain-containing protein n=1 Tax=Kockovaella imperatae TaxID=4999 RepID=A0A1Y1U709_9TREE|nr:Afadin and alpha-actinin-binding-domain-containing protein [Kockovaella imperatae]ORX33782.1 Afadin and alpha-actinin-binding-domain-containing protein [Kockovaella imperatae]
MATTGTPARVTFADHAAQVIASPYGQAVRSDPPPSRTLDSLNNQLMTHGWAKKAINVDALSSKDLSHVVGIMFELLGSSVSNLATLDDLNARHRTMTYEQERLQKQLSAQMSVRARIEAEMLGYKARHDELEKQLKGEREQVKDLREELARGRKALESVKLAALHDAKKSQMQLDKAHQQLARIAGDPTVPSKPQGLIILNPVTANRSHPIAPAQSTLVEQTVKDLAEIRATLQEEADAFRHVVVSTANTMRDIIAAAEAREEPTRVLHAQFFAQLDSSRSRSATQQIAPTTSHPAIADARLKNLLGDINRIISDGINVALHTQEFVPISPEEEERRQERIKEEMQARADLENHVKDLEVEIACVRTKEEEAKRVIEELSRAQATRETTPTDGVQQRMERELREQRVLLEEERRKFTEAAMRLGQERRHFESERTAFLEERRQADLDAMQGYLPSSPSQTSSSSKGHQHVTEPLDTHVAPTSPWIAHRSIMPSPLSVGHKPRTPKVHSVSRKKVKTPLSRLVLEKGLKAKSKALEPEEVVVEKESRPSEPAAAINVLGAESGRKTNRIPSASSRSAVAPSTLGKAVAQDSELLMKRKERVVSDTRRATTGHVLTAEPKAPRRTVSGAGVKEGDLRTSKGPSVAVSTSAKRGAWR